MYLAASAVSYFDLGVYSTILDRKTQGVKKKEDGVGEEEQDREFLSLAGNKYRQATMAKSFIS